MSSQLLESIGLGGLDIAYVLIVMLVMLLVLLVLVIIQFNKMNKLQKKYAKFMKGKKAKSLEGQLEEVYNDNVYIIKETELSKIFQIVFHFIGKNIVYVCTICVIGAGK